MSVRVIVVGLLLVQPAAQAASQEAPTPARICLAPTSIESTVGTVADALSAVRETFTAYLTGPSIRVTPLDARLEVQAREEAKAAGCPYLLLTTLKHTRKSGGSGLLGRMAGSAVQQGVWSLNGSVGGTVGRLATGVIAGAAQAAAYNYANSVKTKDELTLTYRLESADGTVLMEKSDKRKADSDGQDLLTPLVAKASEAIATAVTRRAP